MRSLLAISTLILIIAGGCSQDPEEPAVLTKKWGLSKVETNSDSTTEGLGFFELYLKTDSTYERTDIDALMTFGTWMEDDGKLLLVNELLLRETEFSIRSLTSNELILDFTLDDSKSGEVDITYFLFAKE